MPVAGVRRDDERFGLAGLHVRSIGTWPSGAAAARLAANRSRRVDLRAAAAPATQHQPFEDLVEQALDALPDASQRLLENVAVVIEDEPTPEQLRENGLRATTTPCTACTRAFAGSPTAPTGPLCPNKITLFRLPLEEDFPDPRRAAREVQRTVVHELGHHAGIERRSGCAELGSADAARLRSRYDVSARP